MKFSNGRITVPLLSCSLITLLSFLLILLLRDQSSLPRSGTTTLLRFNAGRTKVRRCPVNISSVTHSTSLGSDSSFPRPVPWSPQPGKFLLATCVQGQLSNRHLCVHKSLLLAMLLNRTLILPPLDVCLGSAVGHKTYDLALTIDLNHLAQCFNGVGGPNRGSAAAAAAAPGAESAAAELPAGENPDRNLPVISPGVISLETYLKTYKNNRSTLVVDELACGLIPDHTACADLLKCSNSSESHQTTITFPSTVSRMRLPRGRLADLASRLANHAPATVSAQVLSLGDPFQLKTLEFSQNTAFLPPPFLPTDCGLPIRPPAPVVKAAAWYMQEYIGRDFVALHLRRKDFLSRFHNSPGNLADYFPLTTIAECVLEKIGAANNAAAADLGIAYGDGGGGGGGAAAAGDAGGGLASFARPIHEGRRIHIVFLCTDAGPGQVKTLSKLLALHGVSLLRMNMLADMAFRSSGVDRRVAESPDAAAMVEKVIAANARFVLYARGSSFSGQIRYMRRSLRLESCWDGIVCEEKSDGVLSLPEALLEI
ncbi:unnamed protein product [Closterium sp. NIES-53]